MSRRVDPAEPLRFLPRVFTIVFCLLALKVVVADVWPGYLELRQARRAAGAQRARLERVQADRRLLRRRLHSLRADPQAWERRLDARGLLPPRARD